MICDSCLYEHSEEKYFVNGLCYFCTRHSVDQILERKEKNIFRNELENIRKATGIDLRRGECAEHLLNEYKKLNGKCFYCEEILNHKNYSIDHKNAIKRNDDALEHNNLTLACADCNTVKSYMSEQEFCDMIGDDSHHEIPSIYNVQTRYRKNKNLAPLPYSIKLDFKPKPRSIKINEESMMVINSRETLWSVGDTILKVSSSGILDRGTILSFKKEKAILSNGVAIAYMTGRQCDIELDFAADKYKWIHESVYNTADNTELTKILSTNKKEQYRKKFIK